MEVKSVSKQVISDPVVLVDCLLQTFAHGDPGAVRNATASGTNWQRRIKAAAHTDVDLGTRPQEPSMLVLDVFFRYCLHYDSQEAKLVRSAGI